MPTKKNYLALGIDLGSSCLKRCHLGILLCDPQIALCCLSAPISLGPKFPLSVFPSEVTCSCNMLILYWLPQQAKNVQSAGNSKWTGCSTPWCCSKYGGNKQVRASSVCKIFYPNVQRPLIEECTWFSATEITSNWPSTVSGKTCRLGIDKTEQERHS